MKNMKFVLFRKDDRKAGTSYYWVSVRGTDADDEAIHANLFARLSKSSSKRFERSAVATRNPSISSLFIEITDGWLKAIPGKEHANIALFINDFTIVEKSDDA